MGFCFGLIFGPGIFWGFVRGPRDIFWILIWFYAPIRHLKSRVPPRALYAGIFASENTYRLLLPPKPICCIRLKNWVNFYFLERNPWSRRTSNAKLTKGNQFLLKFKVASRYNSLESLQPTTKLAKCVTSLLWKIVFDCKKAGTTASD